MAGVNGIEIEIGQLWRCRDGKEVKIECHDEWDTAYPWGTSCGEWYQDDGHWQKNTDVSCYDLIELVQDENGFTIWRGGVQPEKTRSQRVLFRTEERGSEELDASADRLRWEHLNCGSDIVAYKVLEQQPASDPKDTAADMLSDLGWHFDGTTWVQDGEPVSVTVEAPQPDASIKVEWETPVDMTEPGYESLADVLQRAYNQAARGKGKERHARGESFDEQVMQQGAQRFGVGSLLFQAFKKSEESQRLPQDRAINELLGSIVYLAGAVIALEKGGAK